MSTAFIKQVLVKSDGVYLNIKMSNDGIPFRLLKNDYLTGFYNKEGQKGLDREIVKMLCENSQIKGNHPSVERYRSSLFARGHFSVEHVEKLNAEYAKLTPEDLDTLYLPDNMKTEGMKAYKQFSENEYNKYYATLAGCADPLKKTKNADLSR